MSISTARTFVLRAGAGRDYTASLPWRCFQCWYSTKQKKVSNIIRWNTENKMLFGSKQTVRNKKASEGDSTKKASQTQKGAASKTRSTGKKKEAVKPVLASEAADCVEFSQTEEPIEWWSEPKALIEESKGDPFHMQNEHYNKLVENEQAYEGELSSPSWRSQSTNNVDIPELLPVPPGKHSQGLPHAASSTQKSVVQKSSKLNSTASTASFKEVDFVLQCPLFPSQFEALQAPANEFHSFVDTLKLRFLPTVNVVLNKTRTDLSSFFLQRWRVKMIQELGEEGFKKHQEATIWQGTNLHACVQQYLSGVPLADIQVQEKNRGHWDSISSVLPDVSEVQALEASVSHPWLRYRGTYDCIAKYKNTLYVIDWKTSSKPKPLLSNLYDNPLQVAAYLGAINLTPDLTNQFGVIEQAAIVVAYGNGEPSHVHRIPPALCQHYWREWCQRLHQYWLAVAAEKRA
ncbi:hypothetical protein ACOMHN_003267 [Nucella lapillus]